MVGDRRDLGRVPGLDAGYRLLTRVLPLGRVAVIERAASLTLLTAAGRRGAVPPGSWTGSLPRQGAMT
jgi:hypothetical protein